MSNVSVLDTPEPQDVYLKSFIRPFMRWLNAKDVSEVMVNRPGEVWVERIGASNIERFEDAAVDNLLLQRLATQIARISHQAVNREQPLLSAMLPTGERIQMAGPPVTGENWALSIRRHVVQDLTIGDFAGGDQFGSVCIRKTSEMTDTDRTLTTLLEARRIDEFLRTAVQARKSMLISGGTSTGKTSLLNALLREVDQKERIITVEDTAEIQLTHPNHVGLVAVRGLMGEARIAIDDLLQASLRMRPDRIILGEIRGAEAATYLRAINTGHPGSITTVHADSPEGALDQLALMVMQAGFPLSRAETIEYVLSIVDTIVQVARVDNKRVIERVFFLPAERNA